MPRIARQQDGALGCHYHVMNRGLASAGGAACPARLRRTRKVFFPNSMTTRRKRKVSPRAPLRGMTAGACGVTPRVRWLVIWLVGFWSALALPPGADAPQVPGREARRALEDGKPIVRAMYEFKQERGLWPCSLRDLVPQYLSAEAARGWEKTMATRHHRTGVRGIRGSLFEGHQPGPPVTFVAGRRPA
jgi:hypothetical protein